MGYTNTTAHYNLPQYVSTDVPSILGDVNDTYATIDGAIYAAAEDATDAKSDAASAVSAVSAAQADATQALADALAAQTDATTALTNAATAQTTANGAVTAAGAAQTTANGAATLLGNTTLPTGQTTVTGAIDALDKAVNRGSVSIAANGTETLADILNQLYGLIDGAKLTKDSVLEENRPSGIVTYYHIANTGATYYQFGFSDVNTSNAKISYITIEANNSSHGDAGVITTTEYTYSSTSSTVPASGTVYKVHY